MLMSTLGAQELLPALLLVVFLRGAQGTMWCWGSKPVVPLADPVLGLLSHISPLWPAKDFFPRCSVICSINQPTVNCYNLLAFHFAFLSVSSLCSLNACPILSQWITLHSCYYFSGWMFFFLSSKIFSALLWSIIDSTLKTGFILCYGENFDSSSDG